MSELFTVTRLSWVALHIMVHSFIELPKPLCHDKTVIHEGDFLSSFIQRKSKLSLPFMIGVSVWVFGLFVCLFVFLLEWLIDNVLSVLGVQQSDSVIHIHILFFKFFSYLLQNIKQHSYTVPIQYAPVGYLFKYSSVYMSIQNSKSEPPP